MCPVVLGDPRETPHKHRDVRSEHAAVHVALIDDDVAQRSKEWNPVLVAREDAVVEHVGVREHEVGVSPHPPPLVERGVAIEHRCTNLPQIRLAREAFDRGELVVGESLGGGNVEGARSPCRGVFAARLNVGERRHEVAE